MELNLNYLFIVIVIFTCAQRIYELFLSKNNIKKAVLEGAFVVKEKNYLFMVLLHSSWLISILIMSIKEHLRVNKVSFFIFLFIFLLGQILRIVAIKTLGERWSTKIVIFPEKLAVKKGIFNFIRHPNYLGVILEIFALPAMGGFYLLAFIFSLLNLIILFFRIRLEEIFLKKYNNYESIYSIENSDV